MKKRNSEGRMRVTFSHPVACVCLLALALASWGCGPKAGGDDGDDDCPTGLERCNGECVDVLSDSRHCGSCNNACGANEVCDGAGQCSTSCPPDRTNCGGSCVDLLTSEQHCGHCNNPCEENLLCQEGFCIDDTCSETSSQAFSGVLPADIILVVDNSPSMTDEAGFVQDSMNDFVAAITATGIDAHVILISADDGDTQGICVPSPLGSGSCPQDENLPTFRHVMQDVASSNSLELILSTYPQWEDSLRPGATKTIAVITDDDSALGSADFVDQLLALNPDFDGFTFHGIFAPYDLDGLVCMPCATSGNCTSCDPCCGADTFMGAMCKPLPADEGVVYRELVNLTGGIEGNLCTQDFLPAFQEMATVVISESQVACVYEIPDPPEGEEINYGKVNVAYIPHPGDPEQLIYKVDGPSACGPNGGWYYDDPQQPSQLLLCPATCDQVNLTNDGQLIVKFGCATAVQ